MDRKPISKPPPAINNIGIEQPLRQYGPDHAGRCFFIMGSSGFAREIKSYIVDILRVDKSNIFFVGDQEGSIDVREYQNHISLDAKSVSIMGSGKPEIKSRMLSEIRGRVFRFVHPDATVSKDATIGEGSVVAPNAVVSSNVVIDTHVLINYCATIGHDSHIEHLAVVSPNAAVGGFCHIGKGAYVGAGAAIREKLEVGAHSIVGMGAVVVRNVPDGYVAVGNPARFYTKEDWKEKVGG